MDRRDIYGIILSRFERYGDGGANIHFTFQLDPGVVDPGNVFDDGKPQACAAGGFAPAFIDPIKALKYAELCFPRDADPVIFDR